MTNTRILVIGDAVAPTGYARVIRSIFERLCNRFDIFQLATRFNGESHDWPWKLIPAGTESDPYGWAILPSVIDELRPDIIFLLYDLKFQPIFIERINLAGSKARIVIYSPIESGPIEPEILMPLGSVARYVVFTQRAAEIVEQSAFLPGWGKKDPKIPKLAVIPHGVDCKVFRPLAETRNASRRAARECLGLEQDHDAFFVFNGNRNIAKKRLDLTIAGFAGFALGKPENVKLIMHCDIKGSGWNLPMLARRHGVLGRLVFTFDSDKFLPVDNTKLNIFYNAADVGINTSNSEGWGLVSLEHGATGHPQIVPDTPCLRSIWGDAAIYLDSAAEMTYRHDLTTGTVVSHQSISAELERLYVDIPWRESMGDMAYARANDLQLNWNSIAESWADLFTEVVSEG